MKLLCRYRPFFQTSWSFLWLIVVLMASSNALADTPAAPATSPKPAPPSLPVQKDWRWVHGAVYVPTNVVNEAQEWDEYNPAINERELHYASVYGVNLVRVFLHYLVYEKKKDALLSEIDDFLTRADKYHIKVDFVFFDSCWNDPPKDVLSPSYGYPAPIYGVHNSRWWKCPGDDILAHYADNKASLKAYVQDIVNAHKDDPRIAFWETYNEPAKDDKVTQLMADSLQWIHDTGSSIPVTATGTGWFKGEEHSDFLSWHNYSSDYWMNGPHITSLCTECMNRQDQTVAGVVEHFTGKVGYILWEFGIGRDNVRFSWKQDKKNPAGGENTTPFHGLVYPDGHPWSLDDMRAFMGQEAFAHAPLFKVDYFLDPAFGTIAKESVTPMIDFDLNEEKGTNVPDSSIKMPDKNWSVRWTGTIVPPQSGDYTFTVDGDNAVKLIVKGKIIVDKTQPERATANGTAMLMAGDAVPVEVDYVHAAGPSSLHVDWSGPGLDLQPLTPAKP